MEKHLDIEIVRQLDAKFRGDNELEGRIMAHIQKRYGARNFFFLSPAVAAQILAMPRVFIAEANEAAQ